MGVKGNTLWHYLRSIIIGKIEAEFFKSDKHAWQWSFYKGQSSEAIIIQKRLIIYCLHILTQKEQEWQSQVLNFKKISLKLQFSNDIIWPKVWALKMKKTYEFQGYKYIHDDSLNQTCSKKRLASVSPNTN